MSSEGSPTHRRGTGLLALGLLAMGAVSGCGATSGGEPPGSGGATPASGGASQPGSGGAPTTGASGGNGMTGTSGGRTGSGGAPANGSGGAPQTGSGGAATGGRASTGGAASGGAPGSGGSPFVGTQPACVWPTSTGTDMRVATTINVSGSMDGGMRRYVSNGLGDGSQTEGQDPIFNLANNATLSNVIIGAPAADGIHCAGTCTLTNVWWEDVGEDAATMRATSGASTMTVMGGGARNAADKVFQHDGAGTIVINNFCVDGFSKLYRSCGNCDSQPTRHVRMQNVDIRTTATTESLAGVNANFNDTAELHGLFIHLAAGARIPAICQRYTGNVGGGEPVFIAAGPSPPTCVYDMAVDVKYLMP